MEVADRRKIRQYRGGRDTALLHIRDVAANMLARHVDELLKIPLLRAVADEAFGTVKVTCSSRITFDVSTVLDGQDLIAQVIISGPRLG